MFARGLEKCPYRVVECPPLKVKELPRRGSADWQKIHKTTKQVAQDLVFRLRDLIKSRRIDIETFFKGFDKSNNYHVSRCQMRRVFSSNSILFSEKEVEALMLRFGDDMGFNYWKFMQEVNDLKPCEATYEEIMKVLKKMNEIKPRACSQPNFSLIDVLGKLKGQIKRNRINIDQFMRQGELCNEGTVLKSKFRSNFSCAGIILEECELDLLCEA